MTVDAKRWTVKGNKALADAMGVTTRTVTRLRSDGIPQNKDGTFDVETCKSFMRRRLSKAKSRSRRGISKSDVDAMDPDERSELEDLEDLSGAALDEASLRAQTKWREAKAQREQILLRKDEGDLLEKSDVDKHAAQVLSALRRRFMGMFRRIAPELAGQDARRIQTIGDAEVDAILRDLAKAKEQPE